MTFAPFDEDEYDDDPLLGELESEPSQPAKDPVNPSHYRNCSNGAQVADICDRLDWNRGSAVKYIARAGDKLEHGDTPVSAEIRDLNKAKWHVDRRLALIRGELEADSDPKAIRNRELLEAVAIIEKHWGSQPEFAGTIDHIRRIINQTS